MKTVTKIVTFYSDGTFTEYTPAPMPPVTVPYHPYPPQPSWPNPWTGPVTYCADGKPVEVKNTTITPDMC